ncbi:hypothetical protein [Chitinophaga varians]|uniref:hypothetical protein n=1 Tax=Chitinophaga varians TaxID=2202339 RepID=UPI00165EDF94|nr:hypothetical protein [Chitinophaga varians]MBC9909731.1 hypothetical protein [Chitinophaga varians]
MSVQNALKFLAQYRELEKEQLKGAPTLEKLADWATAAHLACSVEELEKAFQIDWEMRWIEHSRQK